DSQHVLLKEKHTVAFLQYRLQRRVPVGDRLQPLSAAEVRMHRARLDRSRSDQCDLVGEVLEVAASHDPAGVLLAGALDLEQSQRRAFGYQVPYPLIVWKVGEVEPDPLQPEYLFASSFQRPQHP